MTRCRCVVLVTVVASAATGATVALSGCSSSSASPADGATEGGVVEAGVDAAADAAADTGGDGGARFKLQWLISPIGSNIGLVEAGTLTEAGADGGADDGGGADGGYSTSEAGGPGDGGARGLEGVKVCVYQDPSIACATTAADGTFTLVGLRPLTAMALTLNKAGYQPTLLSISTASSDMDERQYPTYMAALSDGGAPPIGTSVDLTGKGQLTLFVLGHSPNNNGDFAGEPGAQVSLSPTSGNGPFYLENGNIVQGATSFTGGGVQALYYNLAPGMYTVTYTDPDPSKDCEGIGFPFDSRGIVGPMGSHQVSFPIVAGYVTGNIGEICTKGSTFVPTDAGGGG